LKPQTNREKLSFCFFVFISSEETLHSREAVARWHEMEFPDHKVACKKRKLIIKFKCFQYIYAKYLCNENISKKISGYGTGTRNST
jgi:hypothetical protein